MSIFPGIVHGTRFHRFQQVKGKKHPVPRNQRNRPLSQEPEQEPARNQPKTFIYLREPEEPGSFTYSHRIGATNMTDDLTNFTARVFRPGRGWAREPVAVFATSSRKRIVPRLRIGDTIVELRSPRAHLIADALIDATELNRQKGTPDA